MTIRSAGILLHPTALPSQYGIGDLGPEAYSFADFLAEAGQRIWQMLPLNPVDTAHGGSPYHSISTFAGNPLLISPDMLAADGMVREADLADAPRFPETHLDFEKVAHYKEKLFRIAYARFCRGGDRSAYEAFRNANPWLDSFSLFVGLRHYTNGKSWRQWPEIFGDSARVNPATIPDPVKANMEWYQFLQFLFFHQWQRLKLHCNRLRIRIIGDMPIYVPFDSVDVWHHPQLFKLDAQKRPETVSGVPPDYFSETGQLWGHPVYRWDLLQQQGYPWWTERFEHYIRLFDMVRIDHFRGLVAFWEVPAAEKTAVKGKWTAAPGRDFLKHLSRRFGMLPAIAEDLGTITADVREVVRDFGLPGMRVLQFAFGDDFPDSAFLPHNHVRNCIVYTGTHDNNTTKGWFEADIGRRERLNLFRYLGRAANTEDLPWEMIRLAMQSVADTAVIPFQDVLGLGASARMNHPARPEGNWIWRFRKEALEPEAAARLYDITAATGRL